MPLRDRQRRNRSAPHKLAVTVFTLTGAIKKLRAWAGNAPDAQRPMDLFRGMGSRQIFAEFMAQGGTEFAPMSSTGELWVALKYSQGGEVATLLWLRTKNFMDRGVALTWISAYPHEKEFVYPPLTYMKPLHQEPLICTIGGVTYQVVEVSAQM